VDEEKSRLKETYLLTFVGKTNVSGNDVCVPTSNCISSIYIEDSNDKT
jgi:hypothetical protein